MCLAVDIGGTKLAAARGRRRGPSAVAGARCRRRSAPTPNSSGPSWRRWSDERPWQGAGVRRRQRRPHARPAASWCPRSTSRPGGTSRCGRRLAELTGLPDLRRQRRQGAGPGRGLVWGRPRGRNYLAMVVSTGVGGGIVLDGRLLDGADGNAGHIGHVIVVPGGRLCACGAHGCLEAEVSGRSIAAITGRPGGRGRPRCGRPQRPPGRPGGGVGRQPARPVAWRWSRARSPWASAPRSSPPPRPRWIGRPGSVFRPTPGSSPPGWVPTDPLWVPPRWVAGEWAGCRSAVRDCSPDQSFSFPARSRRGHLLLPISLRSFGVTSEMGLGHEIWITPPLGERRHPAGRIGTRRRPARPGRGQRQSRSPAGSRPAPRRHRSSTWSSFSRRTSPTTITSEPIPLAANTSGQPFRAGHPAPPANGLNLALLTHNPNGVNPPPARPGQPE